MPPACTLGKLRRARNMRILYELDLLVTFSWTDVADATLGYSVVYYIRISAMTTQIHNGPEVDKSWALPVGG